MTNVEIIKNFYASDNYRDLTYVERLMDDSIILEWNSSVGNFIYNKADFIRLSKELFENFTDTKIEILTLFGEGNFVSIRFNYHASTIENPSEFVLIAKFMVIWEFKDGKIINGYQASTVD
jgi:hypothetical protein